MSQVIEQRDRGVTTKEAAALLGVSEITIKRHLDIAGGTLPSFQVGRTRRIRLSRLWAWAENRLGCSVDNATIPNTGIAGRIEQMDKHQQFWKRIRDAERDGRSVLDVIAPNGKAIREFTIADFDVLQAGRLGIERKRKLDAYRDRLLDATKRGTPFDVVTPDGKRLGDCTSDDLLGNARDHKYLGRQGERVARLQATIARTAPRVPTLT